EKPAPAKAGRMRGASGASCACSFLGRQQPDNIKGFRAVTARATFLCLCKETWRKESTPRLRARCCAPGSRSRRDFPRGHPALAENAAHSCAAPCGSVRRLRRYGGAPKIKVKIKITSNSNSPAFRRSGGSRALCFLDRQFPSPKQSRPAAGRL